MKTPCISPADYTVDVGVGDEARSITEVEKNAY